MEAHGANYRQFMRKICTFYWLLLTALLLARNPLGWFNNRPHVDAVYGYLEPIAHFVSFALLSLLVLATGWRILRGWQMAILAGYGLATELIQSRIPGRHMQLIDLVQDFAGILCGWAAYSCWQRFAWRGVIDAPPVQDVWQHPRRREPLAREANSDSVAS